MTAWRILGASALWLGLAAAPALAQLQAPSGGAGQGAAMAAQDDSAVTTFQGLQVQARRLIMDPTVKGFRLILSLRDTTEDKPRFAALMGPTPTMLDDMGNLYQATFISGGLGACGSLQYNEAKDCRYRDPASFVELPKGRDVNFVLTLAPVEGRVLDDLRAMATAASLTARIALVPTGENHNSAIAADVVLNDLQLPQ